MGAFSCVQEKVSKEKLFYSRFSLFERKDAAKEAKKLAVLSPVQIRYKGENRSPTAPRRRNHAIGHGLQTFYVALALRAIASKNKFASTRDSLPLEGGGPRSGRRSSGRVPRAAESLALSGLPRDAWSPIESELADRAAVYFEQPDCSKAALPLVRVRTRR